MGVLLAMILFSLCTPATFSPVTNNLVSENTYENIRDKRIDESEYMNAVRGGGGGEQAGDGGQANSSPQGGGSGVVPVYAAGAAGQRRNHKGGAATRTPCWKGGFAILIATLASLLL